MNGLPLTRRGASRRARLVAVGVRGPGDARLRRRRVAALTREMSVRSRTKRAELSAFLDMWGIYEVHTDTGGRWVAFPGWDIDALLSRGRYRTLAEAKAAVTAAGGMLRPARGL